MSSLTTMTLSYLQIITGSLRQTLTEPWRRVESAASTTSGTSLSIPFWIFLVIVYWSIMAQIISGMSTRFTEIVIAYKGGKLIRPV